MAIKFNSMKLWRYKGGLLAYLPDGSGDDYVWYHTHLGKNFLGDTTENTVTVTGETFQGCCKNVCLKLDELYGDLRFEIKPALAQEIQPKEKINGSRSFLVYRDRFLAEENRILRGIL